MASVVKKGLIDQYEFDVSGLTYDKFLNLQTLFWNISLLIWNWKKYQIIWVHFVASFSSFINFCLEHFVVASSQLSTLIWNIL